MKIFGFISVVLFFFSCKNGRNLTQDTPTEITKSTHDTIRTYYQNGQIHREVFLTNGMNSGYVEYYFPDGEIKSKSFPRDGSGNMTLSFDRNGNVLSESTYENGFRYKREYLNNQLIEESVQNDSFLWCMTWFEKGSPKSLIIRKKGSEVYCFKEPIIRSTTETDSVVNCYCNGIRVEWKDSLYRTLDGGIVNEEYYSLNLEYFESGLVKRKTEKNNKFQISKEWDKEGNIVIDTVITAEVEAIVQPYGVGVPKDFVEEGGPLLKTPFPLRDTLVQKVKLIYKEDTVALISIQFTYHDSLGLSHYSGANFGVQMVNNKKNYGISLLDYSSDYNFYVDGTEEYGILVGLSKSSPKTIIFHVLTEYWISEIIEDTPIPVEMN